MSCQKCESRSILKEKAKIIEILEETIRPYENEIQKLKEEREDSRKVIKRLSDRIEKLVDENLRVSEENQLLVLSRMNSQHFEKLYFANQVILEEFFGSIEKFDVFESIEILRSKLK
jgi:predicted RNase H-like nuclease (RuvC/YqgF family)